MGIMFDFSLRPIWLKWKVLYYWWPLCPLPRGPAVGRNASCEALEKEAKGITHSISPPWTGPLLIAVRLQTRREENIGIKLRGSTPLWLYKRSQLRNIRFLGNRVILPTRRITRTRIVES